METTISGVTLPKMDAETLTPIVRAALASTTAEVKTWQANLIVQGKASPANVYRITGTAEIQGKTVPWSLILKEVDVTSVSGLASNNATDDPTTPHYWKRELLVYQSGLFDVLPNGFVAPHHYQIDEQPSGYRIWMEDVHDDVGDIWPLDHYQHVARHFGRFGGLHLAERPIPTWPWLLKDVAAARIGRSKWPEFAMHYPELRHSSPLVQRGWDDELFVGFERMWQEREHFLNIQARLPQTLLHDDSGRKNLFARRCPNGELETVVIDWGLAAIGPIGFDLATLVTQPVYWLLGVSPQDLKDLDPMAFDAYMQGLRDVGWHGDPVLVRLGYTLGVVMRSGLGIMILEWAARDEKTRLFVESAMSHPIEEIVDTMRGLRSYIIACADEARQLIATQAVKSLL